MNIKRIVTFSGNPIFEIDGIFLRLQRGTYLLQDINRLILYNLALIACNRMLPYIVDKSVNIKHPLS